MAIQNVRIMENSRPLAYESLKAVLQYMEPNLRFKLANCIPSIDITEKLVPLRANSFILRPYKFFVNRTTYTVGTYRHYPSGVEALREHEANNSVGGVSWDLDRHGFRDYSESEIITPGDLVFKDERFGIHRELIDDEEARRQEVRLEFSKWILAKRLGENVEPLPRNHPLYFMIDRYEQLDTEVLQKHIDGITASLAPYYCRHNGTEPPYSTMVQFTVTRPNQKKEILRKTGNTKLHEIQKKLATRLFGNRKNPMIVKHFEVDFSRFPAQMTVRLPLNFKINTGKLCISHNASAVCEELLPLIHSSNYPLEHVEVNNNPHYSSVHTTTCNAKKLVFKFKTKFRDGITEFLNFKNKEIIMEENPFNSDENIILLRSWIEDLREIGTCFVSKFSNETEVINILEKCKEVLNGYDAGERFVAIPLSKSSEINVSYKVLKELGGQTEKWMLFIKVVAV